jgi:hypothetical protein
VTREELAQVLKTTPVDLIAPPEDE